MGPTIEPDPHPFDPLSASEIEAAIAVAQKAHGTDLRFNVVSLQEPRKAVMQSWLADSMSNPKPPRVADTVVITKEGKVYDGLIDLEKETIISWEHAEGQQPIVMFAKLGSIGWETCRLIGRTRSLWKNSRQLSKPAALTPR